MVLLQKQTRKILKIGKDSTGIIFPKPFIMPLSWFKEDSNISIELHINENQETYIIIKELKDDPEAI